MYEIHFIKKTGGISKIYVWGADLKRARLHLEEHGHYVFKINKSSFFEWLFRAYIKEPEKRFKKWWARD